MARSSDDDAPPSEGAKRASKPPTSRLGRLARLGALAPRAVPLAAEAMRRALGGARSEDEELEARRRALAAAKKTAEAMLKTLGDMKGLPLKLGQMASYIDGLAPPGYEDKFRDVLAKLQAKAPPLSRESSRRVIEAELGAPPEAIFAEWGDDPFAAASIGQVHRAVTRGGDVVAVKVQYPGIDKAIENDLKSLSMLESMIAPIGRRYQTKETLDEIRSVFLAELDYRIEAENGEMFQRIHEEDAAIVIPKVHHALSSRRVLTTDLIGGVDYQTFCRDAPAEDRDLAAQTVWRFMFRALFRHGVLYADPHPGNYRFLGGGRVAFLDFGCVKVLPESLVAGTKRYIVAAQREDWAEFERACEEELGFDPTDPEGFALYSSYTKLVTRPFTEGVTRAFTRDEAREAVTYLVQGGKRLVMKDGDPLPNLPKPIHMPVDQTFMNRLQWGLASVMAGIGGAANWRALTDPWIHGPWSPPPR